jgi:hypothetical protein
MGMNWWGNNPNNLGNRSRNKRRKICGIRLPAGSEVFREIEANKRRDAKKIGEREPTGMERRRI